jgi:DNA-binding response OmpR family regulator
MMPKRLLVIDDEAAFGAFVSRVAQDMGFEVQVTTRASDFKNLYASFKPTHLVLDMVMPEADGIELVRWLAAEGCTAQIIIVTGHHPRYAAAAQLIGEVQGLPRIVTLAKPVPLATLRAALATADPTVGGMLLKT